MSNIKLNDVYRITQQNLSVAGRVVERLVEGKQPMSKDKCSMCESMKGDSWSRDRQRYVSSWSSALQEGVCGRGSIAPLIHLGANVMNGQVLDPAALSPTKDLLCPIHRRLGGPQSLSGCCGELHCC